MLPSAGRHRRQEQAVIVARKSKSLATLPRSHGLSDVTPAGSAVEHLELQFDNTGTFQEFNDAIMPLGRIWYFDSSSTPTFFQRPFDLSLVLNGKRVTFKDVLSRMPDLSGRYRQTFGLPANTLPIDLHFETPQGECKLRIDDPYLFTDRASLIACVRKWRVAFPFLNCWRFTDASYGWGSTILFFDNLDKGDADDLSEENLIQVRANMFDANPAMISGKSHFIPVPDLVPPLSAGYVYTVATYPMQPLAGATLPEHSLEVLGSFLLGSLVRYRPQV